MQPIVMRTLVVFNHCEDVGEKNEENIEKVNESFISMKGNLSILKKLGKIRQKNNFK